MRSMADSSLQEGAILLQETYYQEGLAALRRNEWATARAAFAHIPAYRDVDALLAESYYIEGTVALDNKNWAAARQALARIPSYQHASELYEQSFAQELDALGITSMALEPQPSGVSNVAYSPDGQLIASGGSMGVVKLYRASDGKLLHTLGGRTEPITSVVFSPDGQTLAAAFASHPGTMMFWRVSDGRLLQQKPIAAGAMAFSPDGRLLLTAHPSDPRGTVDLWRADSLRLVRTLEAGLSVTALAWHPDGRTFALNTATGNVAIWHVDGTSIVRSIQADSASNAVAFSHDGKWLASGTNSGMDVWHAATSELLQHSGHDTITTIVWSPDDRLIAAADQDGAIQIWRFSDNTVATFAAHGKQVTTLAWSPDGQHLVSGSADGMVKVWSIADFLKRGGPWIYRP